MKLNRPFSSHACAIHRILWTLPGAVLSGFVVCFVLSSLLVPLKITAPVSVIIPLIVYGLTNYYNSQTTIPHYRRTRSLVSSKHIDRFFIGVYIALIFFCFISKQNPEIFVSWEKITALDTIGVVAAILLCLLAPGYAIISSLDRKDELEPLPKFLLAYIFSMLVTGLSAYVISSTGVPISDASGIFAAINLVILGLFVYTRILHDDIDRSSYCHFLDIYALWHSICRNLSHIIVFAGLFALVILSTYYLYSGTIIGDQWIQHGSSFKFLSGKYKDFAVHGIDDPISNFFPSFLAMFFTLSNIPSVNAYVSINFLNIMPVFAFYYFFLKWMSSYKKAALLASTLFMLSSGFGWIYALNLAQTSNNISNNILEIFFTASIKTFDIWTPNTHIDVAHPDPTTALILMGLPAGYTLLGLLREKISGSKFRYIVILAGVCILGYLSHQEFGFFIITAIVLLLIFKLPGKSSVFISVLLALTIMVLVDFLSPQKYYITFGSLFGVPFIALYFFFTLVLWALYLSQSFYNINPAKTLLNISRRIIKRRVRYIFAVATVSIVSYLYILSFLVWDTQIPVLDVRIHTDELRVVPWYFYPLRFGVTGLIAISFILSFMFKRFEREIFVFGIIAIIALLLGPYYNEHRFNKYVMASMAGFASLFIYKIFSMQRNSLKKSFISGLIIGSIITSSCLSILLYAGYSALAMEKGNEKFDELLGARQFPSNTEIQSVKFLRNNLNLGTDNVAMPEGETKSAYQGVLSKLFSFGGLPLTKLMQSPSALQESTLGGLYTLLNYTNTRFIALPKQYIHNNGLSDILKFAFDNFERVYEDNELVVLSIPILAPPSPNGDIALITPLSLDRYSIPSLVSNKTLDYTKDFITSGSNSPPVKVGKVATLKDNKTAWSNVTHENVNYIEAKFRMFGDNKTDNHAGIAWKEGDKFYYAAVRPDRPMFVYTPNGRELESESSVAGKGDWFTLKIVDMNGTIYVFLNDELKIRVPKASINSNITEVEIKGFNNMAQFEPMIIGRTPVSDIESRIISAHYQYYYSLTALALSRMKYSIFADGDFSAFSKTNIVLPYDPIDPTTYLEFAKKGRTIIVLDSNNNFKDTLSKMLCLKPDKEKKFDSIENSAGQVVKASGMAKNIEIYCPGMTKKSFYMKDDRVVAPFVIEKKYGNGKVVFVNIQGYIAALSKQPNQNLSTLENIMSLISPKGDQFIKKNATLSAIPSSRFIGDIQTSGKVSIRSSSLLLLSNDLYAKEILIRNLKEKSDGNDLSYKSSPYKTDVHNIHIANLKLYGEYDVVVNTTDLSYSPSIASPLPYGYIKLDVPIGSNITIRLLNNESRAELFLEYDNPVEVTNGEIELRTINRGDLSYVSSFLTHNNSTYGTFDHLNIADQSIPVLMKNPELKVNGMVSFRELHSNNPYAPNLPWVSAVPLKVSGETILKFDHVNKDVDNSTRYITYFKWTKVHADTHRPLVKSVSSSLEIPWHTIVYSDINREVIMVLVIVANLAIYANWWHPKLQKIYRRHNSRK